LSKMFWVALTVVLALFIFSTTLIFSSFMGGIEGMTEKFREELVGMLREFGALGTAYGSGALDIADQCFSLLRSLYGLLMLAFVIALLALIVDIVLWYARN